MTDIFIKSFNRPYYLDRCLFSINKNVSGNYRITILDDGTPEKYLEKIKEKYPETHIQFSSQKNEKRKAITENLFSGKEIDGFTIPTELWTNAVKNGSDFLLMTEDDVWFTEKINLDQLVLQMEKFQIHLLKMGWLGNFNDDEFVEISKLSEDINRIVPKKLFTSIPLVMDWFMYNKYRFFSFLYKLKWVNNLTYQKYWVLNSILMGLYRKEYWLYIWKDAKGKVDEKQQLRNASSWYHHHKKNLNFTARLSQEVMKTTFASSATQSYHDHDSNFDVNYYNFLLNEAWFNNHFDSLQNYPKDFSREYLEGFLDSKIDKIAWKNWVENFKNQYKQLGCDVEN